MTVARNLDTRSSELASDVEVADVAVGQVHGPHGPADARAGAALWLPDSNGIHMMFMRFPIDAVFLGRPDAAGARPVVSVHRALRAWTGLVPVRARRARRAGAAGRIDRADRRHRSATRSASRSAACPPAVTRGCDGDMAEVIGRRHRVPVNITTVRAAATRALDLALPATCVGCGAEGPPICPGCVPALDARLDRPAGVAIGLPGDIPEPLLQLEWCAPFHGTVRAALHAIKYGGEQRLATPLGQAVGRRWSQVGVGTESSATCRSTRRGRVSAATTRPS